MDPTVDDENEGKNIVGATLAAEESAMKTVFEATAKRPLDKRKRKKNDDPADIEGFLGPWGGYKDEQRVMKPNEVC
jgi:pre-mRNA-processing factor 17